MFDNLNWWEIVALLLLALFIFGPDRLPKVIGDGLRMLRNLRDMARNATSDLSRELGTDVRLEDLHPKTFIRRHLLSEEEEAELRRPFDDAYRDVRQISTDANDYGNGRSSAELPPAPRGAPGRNDAGSSPQGGSDPKRGHDQQRGNDAPGGYRPQHGYDGDAT